MTSPTIHEHIKTDKQIVLRLGADTMSFAVVGDTASRLDNYEQMNSKSGISMSANLREFLKNRQIPSQDYSRAYVLIDTPTMLIPSEEFQTETATVQYDHTFTGLERSLKMSYAMPSLHAVAVYAVDKDLKAVLSDHFPDFRIMPVCLPLWKHLHQRSYGQTRHRLYGYLHGGHLDVFRFSQNRFKFCNSFNANQVQDALYYLLYVFRQLGMDANRDEIYAIGDIPRKKWLTDHLKEYVKNVVPADAGDLGIDESQRWRQIPLDLLAMINNELMTGN